MGAISGVVSALFVPIDYLYERRTKVAYYASFLGFVSVLSFFVPQLAPIVAATALVIPLRIALYVGTHRSFDEADWRRFSPVLANLTNYRFIGLALVLFGLPVVHWVVHGLPGWTEFGSLAFAVAATAIGVLAWSEGLYVKNFHFGRWHVLERVALFLCAGLALASPAFVPGFLLFHRVLVGQFRYPSDVRSRLPDSHSALPFTVLLVVSVFAFLSVVVSVSPDAVTFLLLCGIAAHYFHSGLAKLAFGPLYYLRHNNPMLLLLNSYALGWGSSLDESTVLGIGQTAERVKPLLNATVLAIELGTVFVLVSRPTAALIVFAAFGLNAGILLFDGDNFWKWMLVDLSLVLALTLGVGGPISIFGQAHWIALSAAFIAFSSAWMRPTKLGWLDTPYVEYYSIEVDVAGVPERVPIHPNVFRPYAPAISGGCRGKFKYIDEQPRVVNALGHSVDRDLHVRVRNALNEDPPNEREMGDIHRNFVATDYEASTETATRQFGELLATFGREHDNGVRFLGRLHRWLSAPCEYYTGGFLDGGSLASMSDVRRIFVTRIDGVWTNDGFYEMRRQDVLSVDV